MDGRWASQPVILLCKQKSGPPRGEPSGNGWANIRNSGRPNPFFEQSFHTGFHNSLKSLKSLVNTYSNEKPIGLSPPSFSHGGISD